MDTVRGQPSGWQSQSSTAKTLLAIGFITIAYVAVNFVRVILSIFFLPGKSLNTFGPRGSWALVTGASDGIGKEYALQLSRQGFNVLLVSRTVSKLEAVASAIKSANSSARVEILPLDFATSSDWDYHKLAELIKDKDISILVNNVGQSHAIPVRFAETDLTEINNIITINCTSTLRVTQLVLPGMLQRRRGLILTMGSFGGLTPTPLLATYSGSKAFLQQWSNALASEVESSGVTVHFSHAYLVTSAMSKIKRASWMVPTEKQFVASALRKIGRRGGSIGYTYSGSPYWSHGVLAAVVTGVLGPYNWMLAAINKSMHVVTRQKALKKMDREKVSAKKAL